MHKHLHRLVFVFLLCAMSTLAEAHAFLDCAKHQTCNRNLCLQGAALPELDNSEFCVQSTREK
jgi:hypothetical protein